MKPSMVLLLACCLLATGCVSLTPPPGRGQRLSDERPHSLTTPPPSVAKPPRPQRLRRLRGSRETGTQAGAAAGEVGGAVARDVSEAERRNPTTTRETVMAAVGEMKSSTRALAGAISKLATRPPDLGNRGLSGVNGAFTRPLDYGTQQLPWIHAALGSVTTLTEASSEVADADMALALLRMSGPRLQAAMSGTLLLGVWVDFLNLADVVLRECPAYSVEQLILDMDRIQGMVEPSMTAFASGDPSRIEAAATALPELMGRLAREFQSIREGAIVAMDRAGQAIAAAQIVEMLTMVSAMKLALPRLPPAAPAALGMGLAVSSNGVMMGSQLVVSAEWVEMMRRLVQAGVISVSAASAAVRIHAGGVMLAQAHRDLPRGVREALGEGPEVRGMHETGRAGAGMAEPPQHHVLPREFREWFEERGFTGDMSIDQFCVKMEQASHEAIHGGGDWKLGRTWPGEWNRMIMKALRDTESRLGRLLTRSEVLDIVAERMKVYKIPMEFTRWSGG